MSSFPATERGAESHFYSLSVVAPREKPRRITVPDTFSVHKASHDAKVGMQVAKSTSLLDHDKSTSIISASWVPNHSYNGCFGCLRKFTVFNRRHHCRICGHMFCKSCSSHRVEVDRDIGYVRSCESCYQKHEIERHQAHNSRPQSFSAQSPLPQSVFDVASNHAKLSGSFDNDQATVHNVECNLSPTLTCRCYTNAPTRYAFQSATFHFDAAMRVRIDVQLQMEGVCLMTMRVQQRDGTLVVGVSRAEVTKADSLGLRFIDDLEILCKDPKNPARQLNFVGSMVWKIRKSNLLERVSTQAVTPQPKQEERQQLLCTIQSKIKDTEVSLKSSQQHVLKQRTSLYKLVEDISLLKTDSPGRRFSATASDSRRVSSLLPVPIAPTGERIGGVDALRQNRALVWEAVHELLSDRNRISTLNNHLVMLEHVLHEADRISSDLPENTPLSSVCLKCHGTLTI